MVEESVNFAYTTCEAVQSLRKKGYEVTCLACILFYGNPVAIKSLRKLGIQTIYLVSLSRLLAVAEKNKIFPRSLINQYREFLIDPSNWEKKKGLIPKKL